MKKLSILVLGALMGAGTVVGQASAAPQGPGSGMQQGGGPGMQQQRGGGPGQGGSHGGPGGAGGPGGSGGFQGGSQGHGGGHAMGSGSRRNGFSGPSAGGGPANWHRGQHLAPSFTQDQGYWLSDWRAHGLSAPPSGHRWLNVDGNFVLATIATGVITNIIMGH